MQPVNKELSALRLSQQVLIILIFSLVTIVVWIGLSLLNSQSKTAISAESQSLATPLNPSINIQVLEELESKRAYSDSELSSFPIYLLILDADKQRLSQNPERDSGSEAETPTVAPETNLNSLLPPVTVEPPPETTASTSATTQTETNLEESNSVETIQ
jgi:hypothetical protein